MQGTTISPDRGRPLSCPNDDHPPKQSSKDTKKRKKRRRATSKKACVTADKSSAAIKGSNGNKIESAHANEDSGSLRSFQTMDAPSAQKTLPPWIQAFSDRMDHLLRSHNQFTFSTEMPHSATRSKIPNLNLSTTILSPGSSVQNEDNFLGDLQVISMVKSIGSGTRYQSSSACRSLSDKSDGKYDVVVHKYHERYASRTIVQTCASMIGECVVKMCEPEKCVIDQGEVEILSSSAGIATSTGYSSSHAHTTNHNQHNGHYQPSAEYEKKIITSNDNIKSANALSNPLIPSTTPIVTVEAVHRAVPPAYRRIDMCTAATAKKQHKALHILESHAAGPTYKNRSSNGSDVWTPNSFFGSSSSSNTVNSMEITSGSSDYSHSSSSSSRCRSKSRTIVLPQQQSTPCTSVSNLIFAVHRSKSFTPPASGSVSIQVNISTSASSNGSTTDTGGGSSSSDATGRCYDMGTTNRPHDTHTRTLAKCHRYYYGGNRKVGIRSHSSFGSSRLVLVQPTSATNRNISSLREAVINVITEFPFSLSSGLR
eukprot:Lankesteria_metandrocarpae@DN1507_c0_g1_i1.p1